MASRAHVCNCLDKGCNSQTQMGFRGAFVTQEVSKYNKMATGSHRFLYSSSWTARDNGPRVRSQAQGRHDHWVILHNRIRMHTVPQREGKAAFLPRDHGRCHTLGPSASSSRIRNVNEPEKVIFALPILTCVHTHATWLRGGIAPRRNTYGHQPETTLGILERKLLTVRMDTPPAFSSCIRVTMSSICGGEEGECMNGATHQGGQIKSHSKTH